MREPASPARIRAFMRAVGEAALGECRIYFTGGATAVLEGWRAETIDADILIVPDSDRLLQALPAIKESLRINVELASPADFIPPLPGWERRSRFIERHGTVDFYHYDFYAQALAKIERGQGKDVKDVQAMLERGLVDRGEGWRLFHEIAPSLHRYPAVDPGEFRRLVEAALGPDPAGLR